MEEKKNTRGKTFNKEGLLLSPRPINQSTGKPNETLTIQGKRKSEPNTLTLRHADASSLVQFRTTEEMATIIASERKQKKKKIKKKREKNVKSKVKYLLLMKKFKI